MPTRTTNDRNSDLNRGARNVLPYQSEFDERYLFRTPRGFQRQSNDAGRDGRGVYPKTSVASERQEIPPSDGRGGSPAQGSVSTQIHSKEKGNGDFYGQSSEAFFRNTGSSETAKPSHQSREEGTLDANGKSTYAQGSVDGWERYTMAPKFAWWRPASIATGIVLWAAAVYLIYWVLGVAR